MSNVGKELRGNTVSKGGFGDNVASSAVHLEFKSAVTANGHLVENHLGGLPLPEITLHVLDTFHQLISAGIPDASRFTWGTKYSCDSLENLYVL